MKFVFNTVELFTLPENVKRDGSNIELCIVIPFPAHGKIVDTIVSGRTAMLVVQSDYDAEIVSAHFHIVPTGKVLYSDTVEYITAFKFTAVKGYDLFLVPVIRIVDGDYGMHSEDFKKDYSNSNAPQPTQHTQDVHLENDKDMPDGTSTDVYGLFGINKPNNKEDGGRTIT